MPLPVIVDALWPDDPPVWAVNVVHKHVGALRRVVEPDLPRRAQGRWLRSDAGGYRVATDTHTLDLLQFRHLVEAAEHVSDPEQSLDLRCDALDLWRGAVAEDVKIEPQAAAAFMAIEREHTAAVIGAAQQADRVGRPDRVLPHLRHAARINPTDEVLQAHLVRCLAGAGRRAEALTVFGTVRTLLVSELGVSPGADLAAAHLEVLRDDDAPVTKPAPPLPTPAQLPADVPAFVGRDRELHSLYGAARRRSAVSGVVAITGTAGVGKTALAVRFGHGVAHTFHDGQLYVDLRGFDATGSAMTPHEVLGRFLESLDVPASKIPTDLEARAALYRSAVSGQRLLIVLDNAQNTAQVTPLLPGGTDSLTIVTSRHQLRALASRGAVVLPLDVFDERLAAAFLRHRLGDRTIGGPETDHAALEVTGGLPLALALLAARAVSSAHLPFSDIVQSVRRSSSWLDAFVDSADPRTDARAVLSWSYEGLTPDAARLFRLLAVHPGTSFTVTQAAHIADVSTAQARDMIDELVEANVVAERDPDRWSRHDLLRHYASELLAGEDLSERRGAETRLYQHFASTALGAAERLSPERAPLPDPAAWGQPRQGAFPDEESAAHWFDIEYRSLVALATEPDPAAEFDVHVWRIAWALEHYLDRRGHWDSMLAVQQAAVAAAQRSAPAIVQASTLRGVARAETNVGRLEHAAHHVRSAIGLLASDRRVDVTFYAETHRQLSWIHEQRGDIEGALEQARLALALLDDDSTEPVRAFALNAVGWYEALLGRYDLAFDHCTEAAQILAAGDHRYGLADTLSSLGYINMQLGHMTQAVRCLRRSMRLFQVLGVRYAEAAVALDLGRALGRTRYRTMARRVLSGAADVFRELDQQMSQQASELLAELDTVEVFTSRTC